MKALSSLTKLRIPLAPKCSCFLLGWATTAVMSRRANVFGYRPGQFASHGIVGRVRFTYHDRDELEKARNLERAMEPRVYIAADADQWSKLQEMLLALPKQLAEAKEED